MKIYDRVTTPDGEGIIVGVDLPESRLSWAAGCRARSDGTITRKSQRYVIKLDHNEKYNFNPCYWPKELKKVDADGPTKKSAGA